MKKISIGIIIILILLFGTISLIRSTGESYIKKECVLFINDKESDFPSFGMSMYDRMEELFKDIKSEDRNKDLKGLTNLQIMVKICEKMLVYDSIDGLTTENFDKAIFQVLTKE